jgi:hypothetical protein
MGILTSTSEAIFGRSDYEARLDNLNSEWNALQKTIDSCALTPGSAPAFQQFYDDQYAWNAFYDSETSFFSSSHSEETLATWTGTLQKYTKLAPQFCGAGTDSAGNPAYIPGVKDQPTEESIFKPLTDAAKAPFLWAEDLALKVGIGIAVILVIVIAAIVWIALKGKANVGAKGVSVG